MLPSNKHSTQIDVALQQYCGNTDTHRALAMSCASLLAWLQCAWLCSVSTGTWPRRLCTRMEEMSAPCNDRGFLVMHYSWIIFLLYLHPLFDERFLQNGEGRRAEVGGLLQHSACTYTQVEEGRLSLNNLPQPSFFIHLCMCVYQYIVWISIYYYKCLSFYISITPAAHGRRQVVKWGSST